MRNFRRNMKKIVPTVILAAMAIQSFSQKLPASDSFKTPSGDLELHFIGHGSLMFKVNDFVIHIDPVSSEGNYDSKPNADLILVTHEHYDHLDPALIEKLRKEETLLFSTEKVKAQVKWAEVMNPGDRKKAAMITVEAVHAYNIVHKRAQGQPYHPKGTGLGFIIETGDKRIYVAGDTENIPEMKALRNIYIAFLPMNLPYTMTPEMVADAAKAFSPAILYPYHFGDTNTDILVNLMKGTDTEVRIRNLK